MAGLLLTLLPHAQAQAERTEASIKLMVVDFQLDDRTDLPDAPEELARIRLLTETYRKNLESPGIALVPVNERIRAAVASQSATYLFDHAEYAAGLAEDSGADYLLINVALKPTYLFVYPRLLLVDIPARKVVLAKAAQLESSWSDPNTTIKTGEKLAQMVKARLKELAAGLPSN